VDLSKGLCALFGSFWWPYLVAVFDNNDDEQRRLLEGTGDPVARYSGSVISESCRVLDARNTLGELGYS